MQKHLEQFIRDIKNKGDIRWDEANTKSYIIEQVLTHLKWNVHSPDDIAREQGRKKKIDYELKAGDMNIGIEAKAIKQNLNEEDGKQLLGYCGDTHVLAILTNGKDWWFYLPQAEGGPSRKRFYMMDIFQNPSDAALKFTSLLSKENIINGDAVKNAKSIYRERRNEIERPVRTKVELEVSKVEKPIQAKIEKPVQTKVELEVSKVEKEQDYISVDSDFVKKAVESYYFNGSTYNIDSWKGLLVGILDNIYTLHKKDFENVLGVTGGNGRIYFSRDQDDVSTPFKIKDTDIYVDTKLSANNIVRLCSDIIYEFGYSNNDLKIKISPGNIKETTSQPIVATAKPVDTEATDSKKNKMVAQPVDAETINSQKTKMIAQPVDTNADMIISEKNKRERYGEYVSAIQKILPDIKKMISSAKGKEIKFRIMDIAKDLGNDFVDKNPTTIYRGLKYALSRGGVTVDLTTYSGEKLLTMRDVTPDDKLSESITEIPDEKHDINMSIDNNVIIKDVDIKKVSIADIKENKNTVPEKEGVKKERYGKYAQAIDSHIGWIKERIASSQDGTVTIEIRELVKKMGSDFEKKSDTTIWWALKYVLFYEEIIVEMGSQEGGEKVLKMRTRKSEDELPPSLAKLDNKEDTS